MLRRNFKSRSLRSIFRAALPVALLLTLLPGDAAAEDQFKPFKLKTLDGAERTLQDFSGKATLVSFFFPTCRFCNAEFPEVQKMYERYQDRGLAMVWINVVPSENKKIAGWVAQGGYTVPVLMGSSQQGFQRDYKLKMTPTHYLLNPAGQVVFTAAGYEPGDERELEAAIRAALGNTP